MKKTPHSFFTELATPHNPTFTKPPDVTDPDRSRNRSLHATTTTTVIILLALVVVVVSCPRLRYRTVSGKARGMV